VETVRLILQGRGRLRLTHKAIFFSWMHLRNLLGAAAFNCCIQHCLFQAGIQATSGSTRLVAALARGAPLGDVLCLGDWSNASTHFQFYHALYGIVGRHEVPGLGVSLDALCLDQASADTIGPPIGGV
jgi:hypothetical protein